MPVDVNDLDDWMTTVRSPTARSKEPMEVHDLDETTVRAPAANTVEDVPVQPVQEDFPTTPPAETMPTEKPKPKINRKGMVVFPIDALGADENYWS